MLIDNLEFDWKTWEKTKKTKKCTQTIDLTSVKRSNTLYSPGFGKTNLIHNDCNFLPPLLLFNRFVPQKTALLEILKSSWENRKGKYTAVVLQHNYQTVYSQHDILDIWKEAYCIMLCHIGSLPKPAMI